MTEAMNVATADAILWLIGINCGGFWLLLALSAAASNLTPSKDKHCPHCCAEKIRRQNMKAQAHHHNVYDDFGFTP